LSSSCHHWRSATPWGLASFRHYSASRIFIMQPGCSPSPVVIQKDDCQPCGGEKQTGLRPPSCPQLQGCSSSMLGRGCAELRLYLHVGSDPLLPSVSGGEGRSPSVALSAAACLASRSGWLCILSLGQSVAACPPHGRWWRCAWVGHIHGFSRSSSCTGRLYKTSYATGAAAAFLMVLPSLPQRERERRPLRAHWCSRCPPVLRWSPPPVGLMWSLLLVRLPTTEVVASAGETVSATCCRSFDSLALMASLLPSMGGWGRGPIRSSACPEAIAAAV
jgi:hypothetical protein